MRTRRWAVWLVAVIVAVPMVGCGSMSTRGKTTLGGAGAGGLVGGIIGHQSGKTWQGALIGGAIGAIGGYVVGTKVESDQAASDTKQKANQLFTQANSTPDAQNAIALFTQAINLDPNEPAYFNNRGLAYLHTGNRKAARNDFAQALSLNPSYQPAQDNLRRIQYTEDK